MSDALKALERIVDDISLCTWDDYTHLKELDKDEATVRAALEKQQWQPIETAPKDGTRILLLTENGEEIGKWLDEADFEQCLGGPGWQVWECEDSWYAFALAPDEPTHWQPLPDPPHD